MYKQTPEVPVSGVLQSSKLKEFEELLEAAVVELPVFWDKHDTEIGKKLKEGDIVMVVACLR